MIQMEMNVGLLKENIKELPDDTPVFVGCQGECNYDFKKKKPRTGTDTFVIVHDGKVFITDEHNIAKDGNGNSI